MAGVATEGSGEEEEGSVATVTGTGQSSEGCRSARTSFLQATDHAAVVRETETKQEADSASIVNSSGTGRCEASSTWNHRDSSPSETKSEGKADETQPVRSKVRNKSLNGHASSCDKSTTSVESPPAQNGGEEEASRHLGLSQPHVQPLLLSKAVVGDLSENGSETSVGSSFSTTSPSTLTLPLPPVPTDMAEAIKRQQKGAGNVRYWKAKHLQSGRNNQAVPLSKAGTGGGFQSSMFPVLKPPSLHGSGSGVVVNGNAAPKLSKAKERLIRQRGKENGLADLRRSISSLQNSGSNGQTPVCHTQYMYGRALGDYPPPPAAYRRSVAALESLLSLPFPLPASLTHPAPHRLTPTTSSSLNPHHHRQLTHLTRPNPPLALTQLPSQGEGRLSRDAPPPPEGLQGVELQSYQQGKELGQVGHKDPKELPGVADLTCLQLADAILGTRSADLSQYYQICQTKIRYVDFLERSATFRSLEPHSLPPAPKAQPSPILLHSTPRLHTWVPGLDLKDTHLPPNDGTEASEASPWHRDGAAADSTLTNSGGRSKEKRTPPVTLPSLVAPSSGGSSVGMKMTHGLPPSAGNKGLLSFSNDVEMMNSMTSSRSVMATSTGLPIPSSSLVSAMPSGKPILKPYNPDAIPVKIQRPYDPFSPRSVYSDLSVRGTTMYPMATNEGRGDIPGEGTHGRSQSSKSRNEAELRKRAVRFSISDQVYEFAPGEPLLH